MRKLTRSEELLYMHGTLFYCKKCKTIFKSIWYDSSTYVKNWIDGADNLMVKFREAEGVKNHGIPYHKPLHRQQQVTCPHCLYSKTVNATEIINKWTTQTKGMHRHMKRIDRMLIYAVIRALKRYMPLHTMPQRIPIPTKICSTDRMSIPLYSRKYKIYITEERIKIKI